MREVFSVWCLVLATFFFMNDAAFILPFLNTKH